MEVDEEMMPIEEALSETAIARIPKLRLFVVFRRRPLAVEMAITQNLSVSAPMFYGEKCLACRVA